MKPAIEPEVVDYVAVDILFEEKKTLAYKMAWNCARQYPRVPIQDLISVSLEALLLAARRSCFNIVYERTTPHGPFGTYAARAISWSLKQFLYRNVFKKPLLSLDDELGEDDDGEVFTFGHLLANQQGEAEVQEDLANSRFKAEPCQVIRTLKGLTKDERKVLTLLYLDGEEPHEVIARYGGNYKLVNQSHYHGICKLREYFRSEGFSVDTSKSHRHLRYEGEKRGHRTDKAAMRRQMRRAQAASVHKNHHLPQGIIQPSCRLCAESQLAG
jgi:DNA-directed RNA polymerase specialized sigma subunit